MMEGGYLLKVFIEHPAVKPSESLFEGVEFSKGAILLELSPVGVVLPLKVVD